MHKLLVSYDLSKILKESQEYDLIRQILESQPEWVHLQKSVWVVVSNMTDEEMYNKLLSIIDVTKQTIISIVDISNRQIYSNFYRDAKTDTLEYVNSILSSNY